MLKHNYPLLLIIEDKHHTNYIAVNSKEEFLDVSKEIFEGGIRGDYRYMPILKEEPTLDDYPPVPEGMIENAPSSGVSYALEQYQEQHNKWVDGNAYDRRSFKYAHGNWYAFKKAQEGDKVACYNYIIHCVEDWIKIEDLETVPQSLNR